MKIYRPPISPPYVQMLTEITASLNKDALMPFTLHNALEKIIEIAYKSITGKPPLAVNKRFYKIEF